uniref:DNA-directed RNA polymerase n=1 Tax=Chenopodium quinoa TaxID=63459 RepID=A0A803N8E3_CHEQI
MCQEKLVQEVVDTLLDNGIHGQPMWDGHNKVYKSFSDVIEGKEGRFCETLLGKRVNYFGCSVIVVGPSLSLHRCGLPREIAIELFQTFALEKHPDVPKKDSEGPAQLSSEGMERRIKLLQEDKWLLLVLESARVEIAVLLNELAYLKYEAASSNPEAFLLKRSCFCNLGATRGEMELIWVCGGCYSELRWFVRRECTEMLRVGRWFAVAADLGG